MRPGPNSALDNSPLLGPLLDALGITDQRVDTCPAATRRYIVRAGKLVALPMSPLRLLSTQAFSLPAKLRLLREPFVARCTGRRRRIGGRIRRDVVLASEILDYAVDPFVSGIYAGDPEQLSMQRRLSTPARARAGARQSVARTARSGS